MERGMKLMEEVYKKLRSLKEDISEVYSDYTSKITYVIKLLEQGLETITYVKNYPAIGKDELEIAINFGESIVWFGKSGSWGKNNERLRKKLYQLVEQMEKEIESMKKMTPMDHKYTDLNEWIESLNIGKFIGQHVGTEQYQTSYELFVDLRKVIMDKKASQKQEIYTGRIVDQLDEGRKSLSENCKIEVSDYELAQLIKMIQSNPRYHYKLLHHQYNSCSLEEIHKSVEREIQFSKQKILVQKLIKLSMNSESHQ